MEKALSKKEILQNNHKVIKRQTNLMEVCFTVMNYVNPTIRSFLMNLARLEASNLALISEDLIYQMVNKFN